MKGPNVASLDLIAVPTDTLFPLIQNAFRDGRRKGVVGPSTRVALVDRRIFALDFIEPVLPRIETNVGRGMQCRPENVAERSGDD